MARDEGKRERRRSKPPGHKPWEQQPGESAQEFASFVVYLGLGPSRSLAKATEHCGLGLSRLKQLSARWKWLFRAVAHDRQQFLRRRQEELDGCKETREKLLKESADLQRIAGMEFRSWIRRDERGELQLVRELSPSAAIRLWQVGCEALQELQGDALASAYQETIPRVDLFGRTPVEVALREAIEAGSQSISYSHQSEVKEALHRVVYAWIHYYLDRHPDADSLIVNATLWPWDMPYAEA